MTWRSSTRQSGFAHITGQIPDLIADRMTAASRVRVACAMQPKAAPHFGTGIVILTAFALARLFQDTFATPATVLLDMLDNAPAQTTVLDGIEYTLCLSHAINASRSAAETNTEPVGRLAAGASQRAGTGFGIRRYSQIQAQPGFRHGLADILSRPEVFEPLFSPSEHRLRVRPVCPRCGLVDKAASTVQVQQDNGLTLSWAVRGAPICWCVATSQSRALPSSLVVARVLPPRPKAIAITQLVLAVSMAPIWRAFTPGR